MAALCLCSPLNAARKKKAQSQDSQTLEEGSSFSVSKDEAIKLSSKKRTYFYKIEPSVLEGVEMG